MDTLNSIQLSSSKSVVHAMSISRQHQSWVLSVQQQHRDWKLKCMTWVAMSGRARGRGRADLLSAGPDDWRPLRRPGDGPGLPIERSPLRRPGDSFPPADTVHEVQKSSIPAEPTEEEIVSMLQNISTDAQLLDTLRELHELALQTRSVATCLATACGRLQADAPEGSHLRNLRTHLLNFVQNNYKRRHDDRLMDPARFATSAWLLCEVFRAVRLPDGSVVRVLVPPILEYLTALLHCRQEDQVMAAAQLCRTGGELHRCSHEGVAELVNSIRERLISPDCSHALRADFLLCVELAACRWDTLSPHARHFYAHHGVTVPELSSAVPKKLAALTGASDERHREERSVVGEQSRLADASHGIESSDERGMQRNSSARKWGVNSGTGDEDWD